MKALGIKAAVFDKDNCLTAPYGNDIHPPFRETWSKCKDAFGKENVLIISNSAGTDDDKGHVKAQKIEASLGVPVLRHSSKKPAGGEALPMHFKQSTGEEITPSHMVMTGDRLFTDVLFGNLNGMVTVLTREVVSEKGDNPVAVQIRRIEHKLLDWLIKRGVKPPKHPLHVHKNECII
ncbi:hypothetical protein BZG36_00398 [Bifiguratus adelaidae]|uniref:Phosphatidylglycerophosphatase GEP4, mitochondrial n=1 Tax=Bifiguratus adelaidae TaxID=1938954 RepID=A0A261Y838_9FUNG|nr:hypothetical protein BZG36_00398 [Bifiguratus adelaidae]